MAKAARKTFPKKIAIHLTDRERDEAKNRLVVVDQEIHAIGDAKSRENSDFNSRLKDKRAEQRALLGAIETGSMEREIECYEVRDDRRGHMVTFRADSEEQVDERPLTADERQQELPGIGGKDGDDPGDYDDGEPTGEKDPDGGHVLRFPPGKKAKKKASRKAPKKGRGAGAADAE